MIAWLLAQLLELFDLSHCARVLATPQGYRCPVVVLRAPACRVSGWHLVFGATPVCTRGCEGGGPTT